MIPYFQIINFPLGPLTIQIWGLLVAIGIFVGAWIGARMAKHRGLDPAVVWDSAAWITGAAIIGARLFHVVFYDPARYIADPMSIVAIWQGGMSMFGGFLGAIVAGVLYLCHRKVDVRNYVDSIVYGLPLGIGIGRIGCFLIHDHPGTLTNFVLGVRFPDGSIHHDLGLYESIFSFVLAAVFYVLARRRTRPPAFVATFLVAYGIFRLAADFLRIADARYFSLTPAQYLSIAMILVAIFLFSKKLPAKN